MNAAKATSGTANATPMKDSGERIAAGHVRVRITVAFDGTNYFGWQWQPADVSVQQKIEEALAKIFPSRPRVSGCSRTDTGVHGQALVAHFDVPKVALRMPPRKLVLATNAHLPEDIRVLAAARAKPNFHARFSARGKQYRYFVWNHPAHSPLLRHQSWQVTRPLNLPAMRAAAAQLVGKHDFLAFSATPGYARRHTVRHVTRCVVQRSGCLLTFILEADGFLYKMCRGIVGTLVQVGLGRFKPEEVLPMLASRDRRLAGMTAPAHGLVLWKVFYGGPPRDPTPGAAAEELDDLKE
jgi:tRNA pseudouridine38-40 synthase